MVSVLRLYVSVAVKVRLQERRHEAIGSVQDPSWKDLGVRRVPKVDSHPGRQYGVVDDGVCDRALLDRVGMLLDAFEMRLHSRLRFEVVEDTPTPLLVRVPKVDGAMVAVHRSLGNDGAYEASKLCGEFKGAVVGHAHRHIRGKVLDDGEHVPHAKRRPGSGDDSVVLANEKGMRRRRLHTPSLGGTHGEHVSIRGVARHVRHVGPRDIFRRRYTNAVEILHR